MIKPEHPQKHHRGSSPQNELNQDIDNWVRGLRPVEDGSDDLLKLLRGVEEPINHVQEFVAQAFNPPPKTDDEGRWQDDGGEAG